MQKGDKHGIFCVIMQWGGGGGGGGGGGRREHGNIYFTRDTSPTEISRPGDETLSQMSLIVRFLIVILDLDRKLRLRR